MINYLGSRKYCNSSLEVAKEYTFASDENYKSAILLLNNKQYKDATYFLIQSMEKLVKSTICSIVDANNMYFAEEIRATGHSLDRSIEFLIKIKSQGNLVLEEQLTNQICINILKKYKFEYLNNNLRYPNYSKKYKNYSILNINEKEANSIKSMHDNLKNYLVDLYKLG